MNDKLKQGVLQVIETMKQDYIRWSTSNGNKPLSDFHKKQVDSWKVEIKEGQKYIKLIKKDENGGGGVQGFIVKSPTKGFVEGDMLKAASYNMPATNFKRGNVFEDANNGTIARWTGIA
tara:strand:+ start:1889 stop:2245 length:357 start_codon:yes stop_codon:yes gene_type:complete